MKISKILNNNAALVLNEQHQELVAMGRGVGFQKRPGDELDPALVEKIFALQNHELMSRLSEVLSGIPAEVMAVCNDILKLAKKQLGRLPDEVYLALLDHCHFAIERQRQGIALHNALQWEMRRLYPTEFALGRQALALIEQQLGLSLPEDEAGFIAWHLVNAQLNSEASEMQAINQLMRQILRIVKDQQGLELDEQALNYHRFIAHLKFFAQRVLSQQQLQAGDPSLHAAVKASYPRAWLNAECVGGFIWEQYQRVLEPDELMFLAIHISRL